MAALLESEKFNPEDMIYCENGKFQILPQKTIHDHEPYAYLSVSEIFIHSSNIGLVKLELWSYLLASDPRVSYTREMCTNGT